VDVVPGDRAETCGGMMEPVSVERDATREWMIVHRCIRCGALRRNKAALRDPAQGDDFDALLRIAGKHRPGD
jgi:hypothetical protein